MSEPKKDCCRVVYPLDIEYCPLHRAAPELVKALELCLAVLSDLPFEAVGHNGALAYSKTKAILSRIAEATKDKP